MSLLDSRKAITNSKIDDQSLKCSKLNTMDTSSSSAEVTSPDHGTHGNIPVITASSPTSKCSTNDQMKTFDPGEDGGIERLTNNHCGGNSLSSIKSGTSLLKNNNRNYKAGSKINKLADMLAKRSQNVVEVTENNSSDIITDFTCVPKVEDSVILNNSNKDVNNDKNSNKPIGSFDKTVNGEKLDICRKSRRKSVPNQSCNLNHLQLQSASKSCSDFSKLFPLQENGKPEFNALGGSLTNLQTDESTKKKAVRKNLKNIELSLILPEKKRRSSMRCENLVSSKIVEKIKDISSEAVTSIEGNDESSEKPRPITGNSEPSPARSVRSAKVNKNKKANQRKSKKLVETSTQTTDVEFISMISPRIQNTDGKDVSEDGEKPDVAKDCLHCAQSLNLESQCKAHEKTHSNKNTKPLIKCQYFSKKLSSLDELKSHSVQKHVDEDPCYTNCDEKLVTREESHTQEKEFSPNTNEDDNSQKEVADDSGNDVSQENKKEETEQKSIEIKVSKQNGAKTDLKIDVSFESAKKSTISPKTFQKFSPKENRTEEQLLEMEMLFYSHLSGNIKENLAHHLDGKIDKNGNPVRTDQITESIEVTQSKSKSTNLLSVVTPNVGVPDAQVARAPSPYQTRSKTPNPLPPTAKKFKKLPNWQQKFWEKYNFPTNYRYEHRFWDKNYLNAEKSALYLKDLSCLDIKTQLTMRENIKKLESIKSAEENSNPVEELKFPDYLSLVPRLSVERTHSENKVESQSVSDHSKGKKTMTKEKDESKRSFKPPDSELPGIKTRRKLSSDNSSLVKKSVAEKANTDNVKMMTRRQSSIELIKDDKDGGRKRKGSLDMSGGGQKMTLRRQSSLDNLQGSSASKSEKNNQILDVTLKSMTVESSPLSPTGSAEISGEWVRPRSYLCGTCCTKFTNLWELEDHKWVSHPNVWCTHYEFEDEKIDKLFQNTEDEANGVNPGETSKELSKLKLTDLYKRYLLPHGSLKTAKLVPNTNFPEQCTKCKKNCMNSSEMHKHMLDCGGDTTWFLTMYSSPMTMKRRWRPFGSRRRKQLGRRDLKRNIPSTPSLRSYHYPHRIRTKPGDVESIQKMLANLPEKRARKAINFDEIKTRSQATIHSNRLLRKRLKSSFTNNFLKLKNLKQKALLKKEGGSKSTTDVSSESTPTGSPKRRNRLRENTQVVREGSSKRNSRESSVEAEQKPTMTTTSVTKKKIISSKKKISKKQQNIKKSKSNKSTVLNNKTREKPATRSNTTVLIDTFEDFSKKTQLLREQALRIASEALSQANDIQSNVKQPKGISKFGKKLKKKDKTRKKPIKVQAEVSNAELSDSELHDEIPAKLTRKLRALKRDESTDSKKKSHRSSSQDSSVLRLKHTNKDKAETLKETKQKFEDSKVVVEERETKKVEFGSRRSLRLRSLPASDESLVVFDSFLDGESGVKKEENQKETKRKKSVENSESVTSKKPVKASNSKSLNPKTSEPKGEIKDVVILEENSGPVKRSSRSLRNSFSSDDKQDVVTNGTLETGNDVCRKSRRISRSISETMESELAEDSVVPKKAPRLQNLNIRPSEDKQQSLLISEQTSLLRKTRFQTFRLPEITTQSEEATSSPRKSDLSGNSDLSEMPILAKVEPIRSKVSEKNEKEIPILMPVVREQKEDELKDDSPTKEEDLVSFEIIKKRRKTAKEVSPLKIVKKVENASSWESKNFSDESTRDTEMVSSSLKDISDTVKTRRRKMTERVLAETPSSREKEAKNSSCVKKYFLGICPSEIDKGRTDPPDDSSSDSEPLITFVINHSQREMAKSVVKNEDCSKGKDEVDAGNKEDPEKMGGKGRSEEEKKEWKQGILENLKLPKAKKKKKKKVEKLVKSSPIAMPAPNETQEEDVKTVTENNEEKVEEIKLTEPAEVEKEPEVVMDEGEKNETENKASEEVTCTIVSLEETTSVVADKPSNSPDEIVLNRASPEPNLDEKEEETSPLLEPKKDEEVIPPPSEPKMTNIFEENKEVILPERRSRRISKEIKSSNEFIIDDPLILVDELWSDLDSDSDSSRKKSKKGKKKSSKKKNSEEKKTRDVNLEELLRNFGENKEDKKKDDEASSSASMTLRVVKRTSAKPNLSDIRKEIENRKKQKSYRRLSLTLFQFHKQEWNLGNKGKRLSDVKKAIREEQEETGRRASLPDLPFLAAEIKENPVQVIQCRAQKSKTVKKGYKKSEAKTLDGNIQLKISLPLESLHNMAVFNNNHLTELIVEDQPSQNRSEASEETVQEDIKKEPENENPADLLPEKDSHTPDEEQPFSMEATEDSDLKNKSKRSDVIDKIFYCEICQTYYYSSSQLKAHKLSNRHKQKESEMLLDKEPPKEVENAKVVDTKVVEIENEKVSVDIPVPTTEKLDKPEDKVENIEADKLNEDTLEMPTLEGPFIENVPVRTEPKPIVPAPQPPLISSFGFCQESLKDMQRAIGCTDEEMLILTLLGENTIELENDILDLDSRENSQTKGVGSTTEKVEKENEKANGALSVDLKQRMTSALTCLVNKAVFNLLQKYENATKAGVNPEALSLLGKLSSLSRRRNMSQLNDLIKKPNDGESSIGTVSKDLEKREPTISYKYQCTICGSRFEKASTRECHISRSHKGKAKKLSEETRTGDDEWNDTWTYDTATDDHLGNTNPSQFWCSDCGINFLSPQEVLDHQKAEHQAGEKNADKTKDAGPLQSSTIGSSDEIVEGKKTRRRTKLFSSEELDQQRIIANNELRKLDRKFTNKNKGNKIKWGMDALKFTVEKENKEVVVEEEKETAPPEESEKVPVEVKNIDLVPKLNLTRTSNIPEFKVIQKNSLKNRFQKIIDNKLKRRSTRLSQQENETDEAETEVMLVPVVVKKKNKKSKQNRGGTKKGEKTLDVYDFNESESDDEPIIFSHLKKPGTSPTKLKLVKGKEGPSKNKADSTTKDLAPDDYDSEDSLPLSVMKKFKTGEEEEEKDEKTSEDGAEKSEGILEQVEYLIEQLENETGSSNKNESQELDKDGGGNLESKVEKVVEYTEEEVLKGDFVESGHQSVHPNVETEFLELQDAQDSFKNNEESLDVPTEEGTLEQERSLLIEPESSQSTFDDEDSIPLVLMSKKAQLARTIEEKKFTENTDMMDVSVVGIEDVQSYRTEEGKNYDDAVNFPPNSEPAIEECLQPAFSPGENDGDGNEKLAKPFENVNGNVIYCRNDSLSDFGSDFSNDGLIDSNFDKFPEREGDENFEKEVTEKEDVVIVCSKRNDEDSSSDNTEITQRRKKRFPLLSATIEDNNFRKSESPKLNKEVIVRKIWSRKRFAEENTDNDEDSILSATANSSSLENIQNDASQTEVEKEIIVKKIWSRKKLDHEGEFTDKIDEKLDEVKINQTEISDEVIIKCGPKAKASPKRRKSRSSTNESSKETIMRKIWSGKCTFQTKAALKTYDSDVITTDSKENNMLEEEPKPRKRGRPSSLSSIKRSRIEDTDDDDKDDLDSLLEEIEREELEKAIRLEFLQLRRSDKANVEILKEGSSPRIGLFKESTLRHRKEKADRKRRKVRKNIKHPRQSTLLKRKKFRKKPIRRVVAVEERTVSEASSRTISDPTTEQSETSLDKGNETYDSDSKIRNRKHKKHRHKHHHHKHKHKKSKHHKYIVSKHKSKHKFEGVREGGGSLENADSFTILEKICQDIPNQIENEMQFRSRTPKIRLDSESTNLDDKMDDVLSSFSFDDNNKTKDCDEPAIGFEDGFTGKETFESGNENNIYDFVEDVTDFDTDGNKKTQNVNF